MSYFPKWGTGADLVFTPCGPGTNRLCVISTEKDILGDALDFLRLWKNEMPHRVVLLDIYRRRDPDVSFEEMPWLAETVGVHLIVSFSPLSAPVRVTLDSSGNFGVDRNGVPQWFLRYCKVYWILRFAPSEWDVMLLSLGSEAFLSDFFAALLSELARCSRQGHTVFAINGSPGELQKSQCCYQLKVYSSVSSIRFGSTSSN
eukprot:ANDGO_08419.mRNA.1 hypothetical protein